MWCGAKRFIVQLIKDGENLEKTVLAQSQVGARKVIRSNYGKVEIISVKEK